MYRLLLVILLCLNAASSAPQTKESDVTYVKIQPIVEDTPVEATRNVRESRIEKLPLTIPGNLSKTDLNKKVRETSESKEDESNLSVIKANSEENKPDLTESGQSDNLTADLGTDESNIDTTSDLSEINPTDDLSEADSAHFSDTLPLETNQPDRRARNFDSVETTETIEDVTSKYEDELIDHTVIEAPRTRAPPKFTPKSTKVNYYPKARAYQSYSLANQLENSTKRKFRSKCSCQKIWNCPKLQITVPRCPNEYFLCCF